MADSMYTNKTNIKIPFWKICSASGCRTDCIRILESHEKKKEYDWNEMMKNIDNSISYTGDDGWF